MTGQIPLVDYLVLDDGDPHLVAQECTNCSARFFDRRNACASCFASEFSSVAVATEGTLRAFTIVTFAAPGIPTPFVASVVDLQERAGDGASLMSEAEFNLALLGDISDNSISRVEPGRDAVFGRFITINCQSGRIPDQPGQTEAAHAWFKNIAGVECPDKGRLTVNMFFNRGRLYMIRGINLPSDDGSSSGPAALRFANSVSFYRADGTRNRADGAQ